MSGLSQTELRKLLRQAKALEKQLSIDGPQDDDQLHHWVLTNVGVDIPRVSVCEDHDPPFKFLADLYFERVGSAVLVANRGGSKTFMVAILHLLNSLYLPGVESVTIGAIEQQAKRAYAHFQKIARQKNGELIPEIREMKVQETIFKNGSKLEILPGTRNSVNGPHPQRVHFDEVELLQDPEVFQESRNMSMSKRLDSGRLVKSQDIITSTRKYAKGLMQEILDESEEAILQDKAPPYVPYRWCVFETAAQVENCQVANPDCDNPCQCDRVVKGKWDFETGRVRTLKDVCKGRFHKSRGWMPIEDIINIFTQANRDYWEAQQECSRPSTEFLYVPGFSKENHGIINYEPDPELGPIFMSIDFGGTNPHAVNWYQLLRYELDATGHVGNKIRMKEGSLVCFNEIYVAEVGNMKVADRIIAIESQYKQKYSNWSVHSRFADPQAKAARLDFTHHNPPLKSNWYTTREFEEHVKNVIDLFEEDKFYVDTRKCPMFCEEIIIWRRNPTTGKQVDEFNHCMSNFRYACANIEMIERKNSKGKSMPITTGKPVVKRNYDDDPSIPKSVPKATGEAAGETWHKRFTPVR